MVKENLCVVCGKKDSYIRWVWAGLPYWNLPFKPHAEPLAGLTQSAYFGWETCPQGASQCPQELQHSAWPCCSGFCPSWASSSFPEWNTLLDNGLPWRESFPLLMKEWRPSFLRKLPFSLCPHDPPLSGSQALWPLLYGYPDDPKAQSRVVWEDYAASRSPGSEGEVTTGPGCPEPWLSPWLLCSNSLASFLRLQSMTNGCCCQGVSLRA